MSEEIKKKILEQSELLKAIANNDDNRILEIWKDILRDAEERSKKLNQKFQDINAQIAKTEQAIITKDANKELSKLDNLIEKAEREKDDMATTLTISFMMIQRYLDESEVLSEEDAEKRLELGEKMINYFKEAHEIRDRLEKMKM